MMKTLPIEPVSSDLAPTQKGWGPRIDGHKVMYWALKGDAVTAAKAIGWRASDVTKIHTRFCGGYAIAVPGLGGFVGRKDYGRMLAERQEAHEI